MPCNNISQMPFAQVEYTASFGIILGLSISLSQTDSLLVLQKSRTVTKKAVPKKVFAVQIEGSENFPFSGFCSPLKVPSNKFNYLNHTM